MEVKGDPNNSSTKKPQDTILARALYDNNSEYSQELDFVKGDVLTVLKKDPEGYEGWWICSLRGKVGIAPGNRLEILGTITPKHPTPEAEPYDQIPTPTTNDSSNTERSEHSVSRSLNPCYENISPSQSTRNGFLPPSSSQDRKSHSPSVPTSLDGSADPESIEPTSLRVDSALNNLEQLTLADPSENHQSLSPQASVLEIDNIPQRRTGCKTSSHGHAAGKPTVRFAEPYYVNCQTTPTNGGLNAGTKGSASQTQLPPPGPERTDQSATKLRSESRDSEPSRVPYAGPIPPPRLDTLSPDLAQQVVKTDPAHAATSVGGGGGSSSEDFFSYCSLGSGQSSSSSSTAITAVQFSADTRPQRAQLLGRIEFLMRDLMALLDRERRSCVPSQAGVLRIKQLVQDLITEVGQLRELIENAWETAFRQRSTQLQHLLHRHRCDLQREEEALTLALFQLQGNDLQTKVSEQENLEAVGASVRSLSALLSAVTVSSHAFSGLLSPSPTSSTSTGEDGGSLKAAIATGKDEDLLMGSILKDDEDSTDEITPPAGDLASLLQVYAAQMQSHNLLVRDTVEEFLGFLRTRTSSVGQRPPLPTAGVIIAHAKFLLRCASQLVNLAANLATALKDVGPDAANDDQLCVIDTERLQASIESAGDAVCEALKGLISQTKEVAGYLSAPGLDLPPSTKCSARPIISGPELERLVGAISRVASTASDLKQLVISASHAVSENRSSSSINS